jgi:glycosyltransferase involved in cell wall biosynthesis
MTDLVEFSKFVSGEIPYAEISDAAVRSRIPLVSVLIITYNHGPYIADAIEGVISQETEFPIELIIGEDCSTDNTRSIVLNYQRRYPHLIRVIYSDHNVGMQRNYRRVHEAARGDYIAFCEGDDVWNDDRKLEKQVSVMRSEPDCSMVFHAAKILRVTTGTVEVRHYGSSVKTVSLDEVVLAGGGFIFLGSTMVRRTLIDPIPRWVTDCEVADYPFNIHCASRGKVFYLPDVMSIYRSEVPASWSVRTAGFEQQKRTLDSIISMLDEFLQDTGKKADEAVKKAKEKFIIYLYIMAKEYPSLREQDRVRYMSCLTWKGRAFVALTKFYVSRRLVKVAIRLRERVWRRLFGRKVSIRLKLPLLEFHG